MCITLLFLTLTFQEDDQGLLYNSGPASLDLGEQPFDHSNNTS
jgi:hypothetical protein